jgi:peptidoglycan/xylan/chitin deacetylase (PgdA/CDA1 family)
MPPLPIISFTFDDFPQSALTVAGGMLREKGVHGTYYASMGLIGQQSSLGDMYNAQNLRTLVADGHELACHTFGHLNCSRVAAGEIERDCERNRLAVAEALDGYRLRNFCFPSGGVTWPAKSALISIYDSCRTIKHGINRNPVDLGFLRANPMYSRFPINELYRLIENNIEQAGWLILYTHDVREQHSDVGCTPSYFRDILRFAVASGASIMTVAEAAKKFQVSERSQTI